MSLILSDLQLKSILSLFIWLTWQNRLTSSFMWNKFGPWPHDKKIIVAPLFETTAEYIWRFSKLRNSSVFHHLRHVRFSDLQNQKNFSPRTRRRPNKRSRDVANDEKCGFAPWKTWFTSFCDFSTFNVPSPEPERNVLSRQGCEEKPEVMDSKVALKVRVTFSSCSQKEWKKKRGSTCSPSSSAFDVFAAPPFWTYSSGLLCVLFSVHLRFVRVTNEPRRSLRRESFWSLPLSWKAVIQQPSVKRCFNEPLWVAFVKQHINCQTPSWPERQNIVQHLRAATLATHDCVRHKTCVEDALAWQANLSVLQQACETPLRLWREWPPWLVVLLFSPWGEQCLIFISPRQKIL